MLDTWGEPKCSGVENPPAASKEAFCNMLDAGGEPKCSGVEPPPDASKESLVSKNLLLPVKGLWCRKPSCCQQEGSGVVDCSAALGTDVLAKTSSARNRKLLKIGFC